MEEGRLEGKGQQMATTVLNRMLDEVKHLTPDEQRQLRQAIDRLLSSHPEPPTEEQFEQELLESGILDSVPPPTHSRQPFAKGKPVEVKGKPLSETIVEDRR